MRVHVKKFVRNTLVHIRILSHANSLSATVVRGSDDTRHEAGPYQVIHLIVDLVEQLRLYLRIFGFGAFLVDDAFEERVHLDWRTERLLIEVVNERIVAGAHG